MEELTALLWMIITALLWGVTDPLMKLYGGDAGSKENKTKNTSNQTLESGLIFKALFLFKRWKYLATFLLNQLGR